LDPSSVNFSRLNTYLTVRGFIRAIQIIPQTPHKLAVFHHFNLLTISGQRALNQTITVLNSCSIIVHPSISNQFNLGDEVIAYGYHHQFGKAGDSMLPSLICESIDYCGKSDITPAIEFLFSEDNDEMIDSISEGSDDSDYEEIGSDDENNENNENMPITVTEISFDLEDQSTTDSHISPQLSCSNSESHHQISFIQSVHENDTAQLSSSAVISKNKTRLVAKLIDTWSTQKNLYHASPNFLNAPFPTNILQLYDFLPQNSNDELEFLFHFGFMARSPKCKKCDRFLRLYQDHTCHNDHYYKCPLCKKTGKLYNESIFGKFNIPLSKVLITFYCFVEDCSLDQAITQSKLSRSTVQKIFHLLRLCCGKYVELLSHHKIGGNQDSVQIDETHISRRKYNRGRSLCHFWLVGGISEKTSDIFITTTTIRTQAVLARIISENVALGSLIKTDSWKGYNFLNRTANYSHQTVNHKKEFVNPETGVNTQKIERLWLEVKNMKRRRRGFKIDCLEMYVHEFIWRRNVLRHSKNKFSAVLELARLFLN
jgi:transposase-like protein